MKTAEMQKRLREGDMNVMSIFAREKKHNGGEVLSVVKTHQHNDRFVDDNGNVHVNTGISMSWHLSQSRNSRNGDTYFRSDRIQREAKERAAIAAIAAQRIKEKKAATERKRKLLLKAERAAKRRRKERK